MGWNAGRGELNHCPACQGPGDTRTLRNHSLSSWPQPSTGPQGTHLGGPARRRTCLQSSPLCLAHCVVRLVSRTPQSRSCVEDTPHPSRPLVGVSPGPPPVQALGDGRRQRRRCSPEAARR